jgi:Ras-related protein Rab-5C
LQNTLNRDVRIALVGNKIDLLATPESSDTHSSSRALASSNGILFFETSAETGENLEELFIALATEILDKRKTRRDSQSASAETEPASTPVEPVTIDLQTNSRTQTRFRLCRNRC